MYSKRIFLFFAFVIQIQLFCETVENNSTLQQKISNDFPHKKKQRKRNSGKLISFYFDNEDLIDIINFVASLKEINVVFPMGANAINSKVTLHLDDKITVDEAWEIVYTLLDIAGYSMIAKEDTYNIVKTTKDVTREALPLYIVKPEEIPNTDKRIRYLYYFSNIKISDEANSELNAILKDILPADTAIYKLDSQTNSLLLTDKANDIRALMNIIVALDQVEAQEKPETIQLRYLSADTVANLFNELLLKSSNDINQIRLGIRQPNNATYFKKVRIVPDMRTNRLIVFGRPQAVERVRDFINTYIDVELESGKSILHVYQLQYLDAKKFEPILSRIVKSDRGNGTEQSRAATTAGGTERFFDQVIIMADQPNTISGEQPGGSSQGSNNLVIAARNDDYERIKRLIEELDIPQPQVIIEVLIADLSVADIVSLGASIRNPLGVLPHYVNFQSAQLSSSNFLTNQVANPTTIQADLLRRAFDANGNIVATCDNPAPTGSDCSSAARFFPTGTTLLQFNDPATGQTWGLAQVRNILDGHKILSHPHLMCTNNTPAEIKISEERLAIDQGSGSTGGTTTQTRKWIPADLSVKITPRISGADIVNLNVVVNINQFSSSQFNNADPNTANQLTRNVTTNANVRSGHILALGGLTRVDTAIEQQETPLLGKIPVIGWLFKERTNETKKNNLTVFISPTIVEPRIRAGVDTYTKHYVRLAKSYSREAMLFDNLRDPITRWFFRANTDQAANQLDNFLAQDEFIAPTIYDVRTSNSHLAQKQDKSSDLDTHKESKNNNVVVAQTNVPATSFKEKQTDLKTLVADAQNPFLNNKQNELKA